MNRRRFLNVSTITGITSLYGSQARAIDIRQATPEASPENVTAGARGSLTDRLAMVSPDALLDALMSTPVTTPLFPADTPNVMTEPWEDNSDEDLDGTLGALSFVSGPGESAILVGNAMVFSDADAAATRFAALVPDAGAYLGLPWFQQGFEDYAISAILIGPMMLVGGSELPDSQRLDDSYVPDQRQVAQLESRAVINMAALIDHLEDVLAGIAG